MDDDSLYQANRFSHSENVYIENTYQQRLVYEYLMVDEMDVH
jgi:hypothetical protein